MKSKIYKTAVFTIVFISCFSLNCSKGGGDGFFIPIIGAATWVNEDNDKNTFNFFNETENTNTSTFEGNEHIGDPDTIYHFTGSFTNHNIQFTYDSDTAYHERSGNTYSGTINDASTEMTLHGTGLPNLTLQKQ